MKKLVVFAFVFWGALAMAQETAKFTIKPRNDKKGNSYISVYDPCGHSIKDIKVYSYPERCVIFNDSLVVFVVSFEELTNDEVRAAGSIGLKRLYRINLITGEIRVVDYVTPVAAISDDYKYVMYSYGYGDTGIDHLRTKIIGTKTVLWDISAKEFNGLVKPDDYFSNILIINKKGDECILLITNEVNTNIYVKMGFDSNKYELLKNYKK